MLKISLTTRPIWFSFTVKILTGPGKVLTILGDGTSYLSRDIAPRKKIQNINTSVPNFRPKDAGDLIIFCAGRLWSGHSSIGSG